MTTPLLIPGLGSDCPAVPSTCGSVVTGGFVQAGNGNLPGIPKVSDGLVNSNYKNFGPRMGFAYQMTDNGNIVLRGGYGIFYDRPNMRLLTANCSTCLMKCWPLRWPPRTKTHLCKFHYPALPADSQRQPQHLPFWRISGVPAVHIVLCGYPTVTPVPATGLYPDLQDWSIPYVQSFNLGVQTSFANNWMLDLGYVGSLGRKFPRMFSFNQAATPAATLGLVPGFPSTAGSLGGPFFPGFGNLTAPGLGQLPDGEQL